MSYHLGIDLGTTYTAAAVHEGSPQRGPEVVTLGERGPTAPSVLCLQPDGGFVAGDAAERHAVTEPQRIARQFKRRLGDPTPILVGDAAVPAEVLTGQLLRWVVDTVMRARGGQRPASIVLTHPANWGPYKRDLLDKAAEVAGVPGCLLVTEPQAAAISYAAQERVDEGAVVAVYDLGGGTFDAAVLRKEADGGFTILGSPEGIERLGGIDVDAALFARVTGAVEEAYESLDPDDPQAIASVARLRIECTQAKEGLSLDSEIRVPVLLPDVQTQVRVTRAELEEMIRPTLAETVTALERALRSASLTPDAVDHVLLVGGSSRIPLVAQLVSSGLGRPVAVDTHPKHAVALGAAIVAARAAGALAPADRAAAGAARPAPPTTTSAASQPAPPEAAAAPTAAPALSAGALGHQPPPPGASLSPTPAPPTAPTQAAPYLPSAPPSPPQAPAAAAPPSPHPPPPGAGAPPPHAPPGQGPPPGAHARPSGAYGASHPGTPPSGYAPPAAGGSPPPSRPPGPGRPFDSGTSGTPPAPPGPGYRGGTMPPPPGSSDDLPPGYATAEDKQRKRRRARWRNRALAVVGLLIVAGAVVYTLSTLADSDEAATVADVEVGECFNGGPNEAESIPCDQAHQFELVAVAPAPDPSAAFPGAEALRTTGGEACVTALTAYYGAGQDVAVTNGLQLDPITPTEGQWDEGVTDTYCVARSAEGQPLIASIRGQGAAG
jgi:actin-like ATPase involved in cell morphogenesis